MRSIIVASAHSDEDRINHFDPRVASNAIFQTCNFLESDIAIMILVWMPVYNEAKYLQKAIDSVLAQTHRDFVFIISDNHSTDGSTAIIDAACQADARVKKVSPPSHVASMDHADFLHSQILNTTRGYKYSIFIGGHDVWQANLLECLWTRAEASPNSAIVFTDSYKLGQNDEVLQKYEGIVHAVEIPLSMRPHYVLNGLTFNMVWGGLWREEKRKLVPQRHHCTGVDHLMVAEIALHGNLIYVPGSVVYLRDNWTPSSDSYVKKHLPTHYQDNPALDFALQLEWVAYLSDKAASMDTFCQQEPIKNLLKNSLLTAYICRYWHHLAGFEGGLDTFFKDERVHQLIASATNGNVMISSFIKETVAITEANRERFARSEVSSRAVAGSLAVLSAQWPDVVQGDELFAAAAATAEAQGCDWFVLADGTDALEADVEAYLATLTTENHDAVILFRTPEPAVTSDANVVAWLASGVAVFAIRVAWWRQHATPSIPDAQACAVWVAVSVDQLTRSARCYLGSVAR